MDDPHLQSESIGEKKKKDGLKYNNLQTFMENVDDHSTEKGNLELCFR